MGTFDMAHGFGLLAIGLAVILIGGLIILKVINTMEENKKQEIEKKKWEDKYGR